MSVNDTNIHIGFTSAGHVTSQLTRFARRRCRIVRISPVISRIRLMCERFHPKILYNMDTTTQKNLAIVENIISGTYCAIFVVDICQCGFPFTANTQFTMATRFPGMRLEVPGIRPTVNKHMWNLGSSTPLTPFQTQCTDTAIMDGGSTSCTLTMILNSISLFRSESETDSQSLTVIHGF